MPTYKTTLSLRDYQGRIGRMTFWSQGATVAAVTASAQGVGAAIAALSYGRGLKTIGPGSNGFNGFAIGAFGAYSIATVKARLGFRAANGMVHWFELPAPVSGMFEPDEMTVLPTFATVATLIAAMTDGTTCGRNGDALTTFVGGLRIQRAPRTRANINILSPLRTAPEE